MQYIDLLKENHNLVVPAVAGMACLGYEEERKGQQASCLWGWWQSLHDRPTYLTPSPKAVTGERNMYAVVWIFFYEMFGLVSFFLPALRCALYTDLPC